MSKFTISNAKYDSQGSRTSLYIVGRGRGFKTFDTKQDAEIARSYQVILSYHDFAPKVYSEVGRIVIGSKLSNWGYITQKVKTLGCNDPCDDCGCNRCERDLYRYKNDMTYIAEEINDNCGFTIGDLHMGNFGIMKGKLVVIDTGMESFNGAFA
jgi:hypothetical protein